MRPLYRYATWVVLTSCLLACGCKTAKDLGNTLGHLATVRAEIIKKFGEENVDVRLNHFQNRSVIAVTFVNSTLNQKTVEERATRAQETARIIIQHYPSIKNVSQIWVAYIRLTTRLVVFHWSEMIDNHGFDNEARALRNPNVPPMAPTELDPTRPVIQYIRSQNTTEILSRNIQLEGTAEKGVIVLPHFLVAGDVNKITPKPPDEVLLDFASFSDKPKFPNLTKIVFLSDNKVAYRTEDQFSTSKLADGTYSEFLYLKIPTAAFLKITAGRTLKLRLNEHEYTLTENQLLQMKRMSDYLK